MPTKKKVKKIPYQLYYPHSLPPEERKWTQDYYQVISIDPARKNYALRIERRYFDGRVVPLVFDKVLFLAEGKDQEVILYDNITVFLDKYLSFFLSSHLCIIERQLDVNHKATRISQHTISYLSLQLRNQGLLLTIVEVDSQLKSRVLGAPSGVNLKEWSVEVARTLLTSRKDEFSLGVMDYFPKKQDDLADTICQIEALFLLWDLIPESTLSSAPVYPSRKGYEKGSCVPGKLVKN